MKGFIPDGLVDSNRRTRRMTDRTLLEAAKAVLKHVRITNNGVLPLTLIREAKIIRDAMTEAEQEDIYWSLEAEKATQYPTDILRALYGGDVE